MSGVEINKEIKKQKSLNNKSKNGSIRKTLSGTNQQAKSPRYRLRRAPSDNRVREQKSDLLASMDLSEIDKDTKEEKTLSARPSRTSLTSKFIPTPEPPPTHFIPVTIQGLWSDFFSYSVVNRNLVFTKIGFILMTKLMPGDQISVVNGIHFWNKDVLMEYLDGINKVEGKISPVMITMTVIRVWNISCLTAEQIDKLVAPREEHLHYFSVKMYGPAEKNGLVLCSAKRRELVQHVRANTPASSVLITGDQILAVNDNFLTGRGKSKRYVSDLIKDSVRRQGFVEIIGCRPVGARSSPAPSLEAELAKQYPDYAVGVEKGTRVRERKSDVVLPLESDALEIAYRELSFLKQFEKKDENGNIEFEVPRCDKGPSLIMATLPTSPTSDGAATRSSSTTTLNRTVSSTSVNEKQEKTGGSVYMPVTPSAATTPVAETPRKRNKKKTNIEQEWPQELVSFSDKPETSKITSDIPEQDELKKCDPRSGIVAYIKNKWGGK